MRRQFLYLECLWTFLTLRSPPVSDPFDNGIYLLLCVGLIVKWSVLSPPALGVWSCLWSWWSSSWRARCVWWLLCLRSLEAEGTPLVFLWTVYGCVWLLRVVLDGGFLASWFPGCCHLVLSSSGSSLPYWDLGLSSLSPIVVFGFARSEKKDLFLLHWE